jgi:homocysteine S-methyltransferase
MIEDWRDKLDREDVVIIDGAMGSELARRGAPMSAAAWSGTATLERPEIVTGIHRDYVAAGADVLIANTYAGARFVLEAAGCADRFVETNRRAVELARSAAVQRPGVAVAGSISNFPPRFDRNAYPTREREAAAYEELAGLLVASGVDLIALEMLEEPVHAALAVAAARRADLPLWVGVSCRLDANRALVSYDYPEIAFVDVLDALLSMPVDVVNVMHSTLDAIPAALDEVRARFAGPVGVYPEIEPNVTPQELVSHAERWVEAGARLVGGCCGTGPPHIAALAKRFVRGARHTLS